jgi:hypothetical protein
VGLITRDGEVVKRLVGTFEADWSRTDRGMKEGVQPVESAAADAALA